MDPKFADNKGQNSRHTGIMVLKNIMGMAQINSWGWKAWKECVLSCFNGVPLCATLWTVACQVPLSMEFSRQGYWSRLPFPSPGDLSNPGIKYTSPMLQAVPLSLSHQLYLFLAIIFQRLKKKKLYIFSQL